MIVDFSQGIVKHSSIGNVQTFLEKIEGYVNLMTTNGPTVLNFAHQNENYLVNETVNVPNAWGPLGIGDYWLYWNLNPLTAVRTFGFTTIQPTYGTNFPSSPVEDQHFFNINERQMYVFHVLKWLPIIRLFAAKVNNSNFTYLGVGGYDGTQVNLNGSVSVGTILLDNQGNPIRSNTGKFFTTEDQIFTNGSQINTLRLDSSVLTAIAFENIPKYSIVKYSNFGEVRLATTSDTQDGIVAIMLEDTLQDFVGSICVQGVITNPAWDFTNIGQELFIDSIPGYISTINSQPANPNVFPIAKVISPNTILFGQISSSSNVNNSSPALTLATTTNVGVVTLSVPPINPNLPKVVGDNDPRLAPSTPSLTALIDTLIISPTNNQILTYDSGINKWKNSTLVLSSSLDSLTDVILTTPLLNQALLFDGSSWINSTINLTYQLSALTDVILTSNTVNDYLKWNGSNWVNSQLILSLDNLTDVVISTPLLNQALLFDGSNWINSNITLSYNLDGLTDVVISTPLLNQVLQFNGINWINSTLTITTNLDSLSDVIITTPSSNQLLRYNGTNWVNSTINYQLTSLIDTQLTSPISGQSLIFNGSKWVNSLLQFNLDSLTDTIISSPILGQMLSYDGSNWVNLPHVEYYDSLNKLIDVNIDGTGIDSLYNNVSLLLNCNGSNGGTYVRDDSINNLPAILHGNALLSTTQQKFGSASLSFDGNGSYVHYNYNSVLDLINSTFTIEFWVYSLTSSNVDGKRLLSFGGGSPTWNSTTGLHLLIQLGPVNDINIGWWNGSTISELGTLATIPANIWKFISITRNGSDIYVAIDGVTETFNNIYPIRPTTNPSFELGTIVGENGFSSNAFQGYLDDIRITKGVARYTNLNYSIPTSEFPNSSTLLSNNQYLKYNGYSWINYTPLLTSWSDCNVSSLIDKQILQYNNSTNKWINVTPTFSFLTDVTFSGLVDGQTLSYNSSLGKWVNINSVAAPAMNTLTDVTFSSVSDGQFIKYNSITSKWINFSYPLANVQFSGLNNNDILRYNSGTNTWYNYSSPLVNANVSGASPGQILQFNGVNWNNVTPYLDQNVDVSLGSISTNQVLAYNGSYWTNHSINLDEMSDVTISAPVNNQILRYNDTTNQWVNVSVATGSVDLAGLTDVFLSSPTNTQILQYNGSQWINSAYPSFSLGQLTNVNTTGTVNGYYLTYYSAGGYWRPTAPPTYSLDSLIDVATTGEFAGAYLYFNGSNWVPQSLPTYNLNSLTDTTISSPLNNQTLQYNSTTSQWENVSIVSGSVDLAGLTDVNIVSPTSTQFLRYNGTQWANSNVYLVDTYDSLTDVVISSVQNKQVVSYSSGLGYWQNVSLSLSYLSDVTTGGQVAGKFMQFNGSQWAPHYLVMSDITNVQLSSLAYGQFLRYSDITGYWTNVTLSTSDISNFNISTPISGQNLSYNGSQWINHTPVLSDNADVFFASVGDSSFSLVSLLLHNDGTNNSTIFTDSSEIGNIVNSHGLAKISTTISQFGGSSLYLDGNASYLDFSYNSSLDILLSDFTVETWVYSQGANAGGRRLFSFGGGAVTYNSTNGIHLLIQINPSLQLEVSWWNGSSQTTIHTTATIPNTTQTFISISKSAGNVYLGINGTVETFSGNTYSRPTTNPILAIGTINGETGSSLYAFQGYLDDIRITKGLARYTSNYSNPTSAFPDTSGPLSHNQILRYNGNKWVNFSPIYGTTILDGLTDVTISTPTNNQILQYNIVSGQWENVSISFGVGASNLGDLNDVLLSTPTTNQFLTYSGSAWINTSISLVTNLDMLTDVVITTPSNNQIIKYNGTNWVNTTQSFVTNLDSLTDVVITGPSNNQILQYNGVNWINSNLPSYTNQNITLSGDVSGSGTTSISVTLNTIPISKGGTGQITANLSLNALLPSQSGNNTKFLTTDGTNSSWANIPTPVTTLDGLTDVILPSPASGDVVSWNGFNWINTSISGAIGNDMFHGIYQSYNTTVTGNVPTIVGSFQLPAGIYYAPSAKIGNLNPLNASTVQIWDSNNSTIYATIGGVIGTSIWRNAVSGFTLLVTTDVDIVIFSDNPSAIALFQGIRIVSQ